MARQITDFDEVPREKLIEIIRNQRSELHNMGELQRRSIDEHVRLSQKLDHWRKTLKELVRC